MLALVVQPRFPALSAGYKNLPRYLNSTQLDFFAFSVGCMNLLRVLIGQLDFYMNLLRVLIGQLDFPELIAGYMNLPLVLIGQLDFQALIAR